MKNRLYDNKYCSLDKSNDLFGTYFKAKTILDILDKNSDYIGKNNMIALYGAWGSGKTSVINFISNKVENLIPIVFEAWKYEKDEELALSLFELLSTQFKKELKDEKKHKHIYNLIEETRVIAKTLFCFSKNVITSSEINLLGIKFSLDKANEKTIDEMKRYQELYQRSYYSAVEKFNKLFSDLLNKYTDFTKKNILIFIDDLDRCEPNKVVDLLAAVKHFFVNTDKAIFFCAIDKKAVSESINIRYGNVVVAEEYLEKIFDITFNMPQINTVSFIVNDFILNIDSMVDINSQQSDIKLISRFLANIGFTNPRKVKKVLNKYLMIVDMIELQNDSWIKKNIRRTDGFFIVNFMFIIILYEFYNPIFNELSDYESKFVNVLKKYRGEFLPISCSDNEKKSYLTGNFYKLKDFKISSYRECDIEQKQPLYNILDFVIIFSPTDLRNTYLPELRVDNLNKLRTNLFDYTNDIKESNQKILCNFLDYVLNDVLFGYAHGEIPLVDLINSVKWLS